MIKEGTHSQDDQVNKQLADKERVAAAMENDTLKGVIDKMLATCVWGSVALNQLYQRLRDNETLLFYVNLLRHRC